MGLPRDGAVVGWVGRLNHEKAPELFVEALGAVQRSGRVWGVLIGEGPLREEVAAQIAARGLESKVMLGGARNDAAEVLPAFDALVLSSRREGTPMVLLEAMAAGVPVVCSAVGGVPELIDDDTGWVVPPGDAHAIAHALEAVLADRHEGRRRAANACAVVQARYGIDRWLGGVEHVYRTVTEGRA